MLLDTDDNGNILLELKFCYENKEFNILEKNYLKMFFQQRKHLLVR